MVSFSIVIKEIPPEQFTNVLHFTTGGKKGFGSRIPAVWVDKLYHGLFIRVNADGVNGKISFRRRVRVELGIKYDITIKQWYDKKENRYWNQLIIPGVPLNKGTERYPVYNYMIDKWSFHNVELYTSDDWWPAFTSDLGEISNLKIENNEGDLISLDKDAPLL